MTDAHSVMYTAGLKKLIDDYVADMTERPTSEQYAHDGWARYLRAFKVVGWGNFSREELVGLLAIAVERLAP